jgi:hypothetical protein
MQTHRGQHPDDRTAAEAGRPERLIDKNPVRDAVIRQALYLESVMGALGQDYQTLDDIQFAALSGKTFGPTVGVDPESGSDW